MMNNVKINVPAQLISFMTMYNYHIFLYVNFMVNLPLLCFIYRIHTLYWSMLFSIYIDRTFVRFVLFRYNIWQWVKETIVLNMVIFIGTEGDQIQFKFVAVQLCPYDLCILLKDLFEQFFYRDHCLPGKGTNIFLHIWLVVFCAVFYIPNFNVN